MMAIKQLYLQNENATTDLGKKLAKILPRGSFVSLIGDLGAGKSVLARSIIRASSTIKNLEVPSPSFALVQEYNMEGGYNIYHCDFYRFRHPSEILQLDLDILSRKDLYLIEWAQKAHGFLPEPDLCISLHHYAQGRMANFEGCPLIIEQI